MSLNFDFLFQGNYADLLINGAILTLLLFGQAFCLAILLALVLIGLRESKVPPFEWFVIAYVTYHRNVPLIVQLFVWYFGIPQVFPVWLQQWINQHNSEMVFAIIALSLNFAAYMSEDMRSGLRAVHPGQSEAARALGFSYVQSLRDILLPQALRHALPPLTNQALNLFKATSLAMAIGVTEMSYASHTIDNSTFRTFEAYAIASVFYLLGSLLIVVSGAYLSPPRAQQH